MNYRYPGLRPFNVDESHLFFGRENELNKLIDLLTINQIVVLFSKSGYGKTSLLQAGLYPKILAVNESNFPVLLRLNNHTVDYSESLTDKLIKELSSKLKLSESTYLDKIYKNEKSLWYQFKRAQQFHKIDKFTIILDQFEKYFTYSDVEQNLFKEELATLLYSKIPQNVRDEYSKKVEKNKELLTQEEIALFFKPLEIKIVFAVRSENLGYLNKLHDFIPNILQNCLEINAFNREQAEDALQIPGALFSHGHALYASRRFDFSEDAKEKILNFLTVKDSLHQYNTKDFEIEPFQLQIFSSYIEKNIVIAHGLDMKDGFFLTPEHLNGIEDIYINYYKSIIERIDDVREQKAVRLFVEEGLIFEEEPVCLTMYEGFVEKKFGVSASILKILEDGYLLRAEPHKFGDVYYVISHNSLVIPILSEKKKRREEEKIEAEKLAAQRMLEERKKLLAKQRKTMLMVFLGIFAITATIFSMFINTQKNKILKQNTHILQQRDSIVEEKIKIEAHNLNSQAMMHYIIDIMNDEIKQDIFEKLEFYTDTLDSLRNYKTLELQGRIFLNMYLQMKAPDSLLAEAYANLAWYQLKNKNFNEALISAENGVKFDKKTSWLKENLAFAYFYNNRFEDGKNQFLLIKDSTYNNVPYNEQFKEDLNKMIEDTDSFPPNYYNIKKLLNIQ